MALLGSSLSLGLWTVSSTWIGLIVGFCMMLWFVQNETRKAGYDGKKLREAVGDSVFYGVFAALLTPIFVIPREVLDRPFQILLGGLIPYASWVGWTIGLVYFFWRLRKQQIPWTTLLDVLVPAFLAGWSAYSLLVVEYGTRTGMFWGVQVSDGVYHSVNLYRFVLFAVAVGGLVRWMPLSVKGRRGTFALVIFGFSTLLLSLVQFNQNLWLYLTPLQWVALLSGVTGIYLLNKEREEEVNSDPKETNLDH
ncbi:hypothetical protein JJB07_02825 [Tumebacillus sp. ITR2]|uniref:Prolipoprotein diacylglyceryl transferase n=1 Tax=Tumebacillus amylolyticus TaxID=2801339 RepID=A0ABS1J7D3_9BACL|nr:hypothetical protein [Tumebacillus amylolyticus]MBL0385573.1 hypothetical protein [Tumebacillus amylolyticus]